MPSCLDEESRGEESLDDFRKASALLDFSGEVPEEPSLLLFVNVIDTLALFVGKGEALCRYVEGSRGNAVEV